MKFLHRDIADIAVSKLRDLVPFGLALMDNRGIILSSTRAELVGRVSPAAQRCLADRADVRIYPGDSSDVDGSYSILRYEDLPIGVIAVFGEAADLERYVKLTRITAELLVLQEQTLRKKQIKGQSINDFMHEWLFHTKEYSDSFLFRGKALGISVDKPYFVAIFQHAASNLDEQLPQIRATCLHTGDLWVKINNCLLAVATYNKKRCNTMICSVQSILPSLVGVGSVTRIIYDSLQQALEALRLGPIFASKTTQYHYSDFAFINQLSNIGTPEMFEEIKRLSECSHGVDMIKTLLTFMNCSAQITPTAQALFIHRNTLKYRLDKILEVSGKDPQKMEDLFYLYTAVIHYLLVLRDKDDKTQPQSEVTDDLI